MKRKALIIGNSDGIGLSITRELLKREWQVTGISRSKSQVEDPFYKHIVSEVQNDDYLKKLKSMIDEEEFIDLCIYCAGIGDFLDISNMTGDIEIFEVNLLGLVKTVSLIVPKMISEGKGHFIGLSSIADILLSPEAPSYNASKAGFSNYLEGLALALKSKDIYISNVRFGFVDTKMAKGDTKPFMITVERATQHLIKCIKKKPSRYTAPWIAGLAVKIMSIVMKS